MPNICLIIKEGNGGLMSWLFWCHRLFWCHQRHNMSLLLTEFNDASIGVYVLPGNTAGVNYCYILPSSRFKKSMRAVYYSFKTPRCESRNILSTLDTESDSALPKTLLNCNRCIRSHSSYLHVLCCESESVHLLICLWTLWYISSWSGGIFLHAFFIVECFLQRMSILIVDEKLIFVQISDHDEVIIVCLR